MKIVPFKSNVSHTIAVGTKVHLQLPAQLHKKTFCEFIHRNKEFHEPWVYIPDDPKYFDQYIRRMKMGKMLGFFVYANESGNFVGVVNLNNVRLDPFGSGSLGYYADEKECGKGYMKEAIWLVLRHAFLKIGLNRVEVNIQPENESSFALVKSAGFTNEGFSKKYLKIGDEYRDHQRWAYLSEDFN
ncbi:MAG: GNAT family N-acetyltransferase [Kordiimonadaceae bacterium]|jgi:[ribosomal protein S5]-alanine N-acetyltransferase|nr:GNAT family N-acetyltransferase [Kordiimonadaceae bacterium]